MGVSIANATLVLLSTPASSARNGIRALKHVRSGPSTQIANSFLWITNMQDSLNVVCPHCGGVNRLPARRLQDGGRCGKCHAPLFDGKPLSVADAGLKKQLSRSDVPLLVDFWAPWCGPCKSMAPAFEQAAKTLEPSVRLLKIDTEQAQGFAGQLGIRSIPTLVLFSGGQEKARVSGAMDARSIVAWARQNL